MAYNFFQKSGGFSLIEVIVVTGILIALLSSAFFIGIPQFEGYVLMSEKKILVDTLLDMRASSLSNPELRLEYWENGYCVRDASFCITPAHLLSDPLILFVSTTSTSTTFTIANKGRPTQMVEVTVDTYGSVDER